MFIRMNESRSHRNLPLASANRSSADVDAPSYSSTPRIGFENVCILRDIRLGQSHRRCYANSSFIPLAMHISSSIKTMLQMLVEWTVSSYESHQNPQFGSRQPQYVSRQAWIGLLQPHYGLTTRSLQAL
jgi:hypothetical protein